MTLQFYITKGTYLPSLSFLHLTALEPSQYNIFMFIVKKFSVQIHAVRVKGRMKTLYFILAKFEILSPYSSAALSHKTFKFKDKSFFV